MAKTLSKNERLSAVAVAGTVLAFCCASRRPDSWSGLRLAGGAKSAGRGTGKGALSADSGSVLSGSAPAAEGAGEFGSRLASSGKGCASKADVEPEEDEAGVAPEADLGSASAP
jgi:hypothetical protein